MVTKFEDLDPNAVYTFADYLTWQFKERVEIIKGKLLKMAMPSEKHQRVSGNIHRLFANHFYKKTSRIYFPLFDVRLPKPHHRKVNDIGSPCKRLHKLSTECYFVDNFYYQPFRRR